MVLPYLCLWRVEFDLAGASVLEPRQAEAGGRVGHEVTLAHKSRGHRSRNGLSVVGGDRVQGDRAADIHGERLRTLNRQSGRFVRSEEHTSELQSPCNLVCRLLLEKKKKQK